MAAQRDRISKWSELWPRGFPSAHPIHGVGSIFQDTSTYTGSKGSGPHDFWTTDFLSSQAPLTFDSLRDKKAVAKLGWKMFLRANLDDSDI